MKMVSEKNDMNCLIYAIKFIHRQSEEHDTILT